MHNTKVIYAPDSIHEAAYGSSIFLAGSIDMGGAEDWQAEMIEELQGDVDFIFNPRRPNWDNSWGTGADDPNLNIQVHWELEAIENSDVVAFYFSKDSKAPITFMELGFAGSNREDVIVFCPDGFYRQGNVEIFCQKYKVPFFRDKELWSHEIQMALDRARNRNYRFMQQMAHYWGLTEPIDP